MICKSTDLDYMLAPSVIARELNTKMYTQVSESYRATVNVMARCVVMAAMEGNCRSFVSIKGHHTIPVLERNRSVG